MGHTGFDALLFLMEKKPEVYISPLHLAIVAGLFVAVFVVMVILARRRGYPCRFCECRRIVELKDLPENEQAAIRSYFSDRENRDAEVACILVCPDCRSVLDDFSWEGRSWDVAALTYMPHCKVCGVEMPPRGHDEARMACRACGVRHMWADHEPTGFRFRTVPDEAKVLPRNAELLRNE
jgi:hypothetical protein